MIGELHRQSVLVTGGTGFIGRYLVDALVRQGANVTVLSRYAAPAGSQRHKVITGDLACPATLEGICQGMNMVFHLGGYSHAVDQPDDKSEKINRQVTVDGTRALLEQSIKAGVERFLFFSSVKAMGEGGDVCLDETAECRPVTSYGKTRLEAETFVLEANPYGLSTTVFRLPMVYGCGCKGNLPRMIQAVARGRFPPLPDTGNRRSMVDVRDVVQAALLAATNPLAAGKIYIVTDDQAYSTRQIYKWICQELKRPLPRWTIPLFLLRFAARAGDMVGYLSGRRFAIDTDALDKLTGSACYRSDKIRRELDYRPAYRLKRSLSEMVAEFKKIG